MSSFPPLVAFSSGLIADRPVAPSVAFEGYWATDERVLYISNTQLQWVPFAANDNIDLQLTIALLLRTALKAVMDVVNNPLVDGHYELDLLEQPPNQVLASPDAATGHPTFRALNNNDIPNLDAAKIVSGVLAVSRIPDLDAAKITSGILALARIPDLDAAKIVSGVLTAARIPDLDAAKIVSGVLAASQIPDLDASKIVSGTFAASQIPDLDASKIVSGVLAANRIPDLDAAKIVSGVLAASQIPDLDAAKITSGVLALARIPDLDAAKIVSGVLAASQIPDLDAVKITSGTLALARIPDLDAAKITSGIFAASQIPNLDASKITSGTFAASQIPNLDASKITSGTFTASQIPNLDASKITSGTFTASQIPNLDASKITTGVLALARIPDLDAAKIVSGVLAAARIPNLDASQITTGVFASARINWGAPGASIGMTTPPAEVAVQSFRVPLPATTASESTVELITNPDFATNLNNWSGAPDWVWNNGAQHVVGNTTPLSQTITVTPDTTYVLYLVVTNHTNGSLTLKIGNHYHVAEAENLSYSKYAFLVPSSVTSLAISFEPESTFNGTIELVSVKEVVTANLDKGIFLIPNAFAQIGPTTNAAYIGQNNGALALGATGTSALTEGGNSVIVGQLLTSAKNARIINGVVIGNAVAYRSANVNQSVIVGAEAAVSYAATPANHEDSVVIGAYTASSMAGHATRNVVVGASAMYGVAGNAKDPQNNTIVGSFAGYSATGADYSNVTAIGADAAANSNNITNTIAIGAGAGRSSSAKHAIYIGNNVGANNTTDNRLMIDNKDTTAPIIDALMGTTAAASALTINANLTVAGGLKFPVTIVTSSLTLTSEHFIIIVRTPYITLTLSDAQTELGRSYLIRNDSGNTITLSAPIDNNISIGGTVNNPISINSGNRVWLTAVGFAYSPTIKRWQSILP